MDDHGWRDRIVGDRMRVDEEFAGTVSNSGFSRPEWGMIMTAVEFEVEGEGESARLVADTSHVDEVLPELKKVADQMGPGPADRSGSALSELLEGGLANTIRSSLGLKTGVDPERREEAIRLVEQYVGALQRQLEESGKWERIRDLAVEEDR